MLIEACKQIKTAFMLLLIFTLLTGLIYPAIVTGIAQLLFPKQSNGSLITQHNTLVGSEFIGQEFSNPSYFWGRPSATLPFPYNAENSRGSNLGPSNPVFLNVVKNRIQKLRDSDPLKQTAIPVDLVTASASGLDPDISPLAALYQVPRIAKARKIPVQKLLSLVAHLTQPRYLSILGEPRVNVLALNLALDNLKD